MIQDRSGWQNHVGGLGVMASTVIDRPILLELESFTILQKMALQDQITRKFGVQLEKLENPNRQLSLH